MSGQQGALAQMIDCHVWTDESAGPCALSVAGKPCGMLHAQCCAECGIRRHGPFAAADNPHFYCYDQPDGTSRFAPPCAGSPLPPGSMLVELAVCAGCDREIVNGSCGSNHEARSRRLRTCVQKK